MTQTARSIELGSVARAIADALPPAVTDVVLTGSVSRGVADEISDIEMLLVTEDARELADCFALATGCGLTCLGTWGQQGGPAQRVSGTYEGVPIELIWWPRAHGEATIDAIFAGEVAASADAIANGLVLRTSGLATGWQERLGDYPDDLVGRVVEDAALKWGGFHAAGLLTLVRPGERLVLLEWMVDDAARVARILFAVNRVWPPTLKRFADRVATLPAKPGRVAERVEQALTDPDPRRALIAMTELELDTLALAPAGPNVDRALEWLSEGREILLRRPERTPE